MGTFHQNLVQNLEIQIFLLFLNNLFEANFVSWSFCLNFEKLEIKAKQTNKQTPNKPTNQPTNKQTNQPKPQSPSCHDCKENLKNMSQAWLYDVIQEQLFLSNSICGYS